MNSAMESLIKFRHRDIAIWKRVSYSRLNVSFNRLFKKAASKAQLRSLAGDIGFWKDIVFSNRDNTLAGGLNDLCSAEFSSLQRVIFVADQQST